MTLTRAAALAVASVIAAPATAQTLGFSGGLTITSNYMSRGLTQSDNRPALQFWGEVETAGFYAGLWASTVRLAPDRVEVDLSAGYRFSVGTASFDLGYTRYLYDSSGDCCGEVHARVAVDAQPGTWFGRIAWDPGARRISDTQLGVTYDFAQRFTASATVGRAAGGVNYGILGLGYRLNESVAFDAGLHLTNAQRDRLVLSTTIGF
jgi:uncharacterized protein (TIGR02001 family)